MTKPAPRAPLNYEPRRPGSSRDVSSAAISIALGVISCVWAILAWLAPYPFVPDAVRWMLIAGTLPSAILGQLIALISVRGHWRAAAVLTNLIGIILATALGFRLLDG